MVNCQWLIVIGKRKVLRVFIFHFSLFTFRSFMCICVHSRHLRNLRSDNPTPHKKRANTEVRPYTAYRTLNADGWPHCIPPFWRDNIPPSLPLFPPCEGGGCPSAFGYRVLRITINNWITSGFQPSKTGAGIDTPPLRDGAEIYRAFSPCTLCGLTPSGRWDEHPPPAPFQRGEERERRISFLFRGGIPHGVRNDKLMVNCQWLIVIGKRKVLRVFIFHFSLFTFHFSFVYVYLRPFAPVCEICVRITRHNH